MRWESRLLLAVVPDVQSISVKSSSIPMQQQLLQPAFSTEKRSKLVMSKHTWPSLASLLEHHEPLSLVCDIKQGLMHEH